MKSRWGHEAAKQCQQSDLAMRVYTSRLLGLDEDLVMHGGGNTSVKSIEKNIFGEDQEILYVKGSGWDLKTIEPEGFSPVDLKQLLKLAKLESMSDFEMVKELKAAMTNPNAPTPSIETILHALIPYKFVDHTHADAVVAITNTPGGEDKIRSIYGDKVLILPFVMPGFILSKQVYQAIKDIDLNNYEGIILLNHGIFTFADNGQVAYENMIRLVSQAEDYIKSNDAWEVAEADLKKELDPLEIARMRAKFSFMHGSPMIVRWHQDERALGFSSLTNLEKMALEGPITPDHVIQTKRIPMVLDIENPENSINLFEKNYKKYFEDHRNDNHSLLDCAPRVVVIPNKGFLSIAPNAKRNKIVSDIYAHTMKAIQWGEKLGGWKALSEKEIFDLEYWELEQAKLKRTSAKPKFEGKIVLVSGAATGIGKATVEKFLKEGACVAAFDINSNVETMKTGSNYLGLSCDITNSESIKNALTKTIQFFGGIDILISNAGIFPKSALIEDLEESVWNKTLDVNLSGHYILLKYATPYLKLGLDASVVIIGSKNVMAPGPGAAAYSCAKAGLTQLARVAALELGKEGIRVNTIHPNAVFDTEIWTDEILQTRAKNYGISVEEYKKNNVLKIEITSQDVADLVSSLSSNVFSKTTGAQIPIDGGNDRVI